MSGELAFFFALAFLLGAMMAWLGSGGPPRHG